MTSIDELLAKAKTDAETPPQSDPIDVLIGGELVTLVFARADGKAWAGECARYPMRLGVKIDEAYGYDFHRVVMAISPTTGKQLVDGVESVLTEEQWQGIYAEGVLSGHDFEKIADAVWALNEWGPQSRVAALKKASRVASATNSD